MNLSDYKLTDDWSWYQRYEEMMGEQELRDYINRVYIRLDKMKVGESFDIIKLVKVENRELFIKAAGWFQRDYRKEEHDDDIAFNRFYTLIFKYRMR
jgi:hypothetical protein